MDMFKALDINAMCDEIHADNRARGWWDKPREDGTLFCLMHSELSEAMEAVRKDRMDDHIPHRKGVEVELADLVIRVMDYCGAKNLDLGGAIVEKLEYNRTRADHSREARGLDGGKKF